MSSYRLATRYAKSLLDLAKEKGKVEEVSADVKTLDTAIHSSRELAVFLKSPVVSTDKKQAVITKLFTGKLGEMTLQFLTLLTKKGREGFIPEIATAYLTQYNVLNQITLVHITSATKLDTATIDTLVAGLKTREHLKEVQLTETIDPSLIGGYVIQYGDKQVDASVRTSLSHLSHLVADDSYIKNIR